MGQRPPDMLRRDAVVAVGNSADRDMMNLLPEVASNLPVDFGVVFAGVSKQEETAPGKGPQDPFDGVPLIADRQLAMPSSR